MVKLKYRILNLVLIVLLGYGVLWVFIGASVLVHWLFEQIEKYVALPIWKLISTGVESYVALAVMIIVLFTLVLIYLSEARRVGYPEATKTLFRSIRNVGVYVTKGISSLHGLPELPAKIGRVLRGVINYRKLKANINEMSRQSENE